MNSGLKKAIPGLLILSVILLTAGFILFKTFFPEWYFGFFPFLVLTFFLINSGFLVFFHRSLNKSHNLFIRSFMLATVIKLITYLVLVLAYVLAFPKMAVPFAITLSLLYIAYTAFDLYTMITRLKRKKEKTVPPNQLSN